MMNLRQATRDSIDRAIAAFEDATRHDPEYARAWAALGGAYGLKGDFLSIPDMAHQAIEMERRALAIDPELSRCAHVVGRQPASRSAAPTTRSPRSRKRSGSTPITARRIRRWRARTGSAAAISRPRFRSSIARSTLNPEAGYSYLQFALLLAWEGQLRRAEDICRRAVELQEQYISGNLGLQIVGAHAGSATCII